MLQGAGYRVSGLGIPGFEFQISGFRLSIKDEGMRVYSLGFRGKGLGLTV